MSVECPVCFLQYQPAGEHVPKLLPCSHSVCLCCLKQLLQAGLMYSQITCPECRKLHQVSKAMGPQAFPANRYILENTELVNKVQQLEKQKQEQQQ